MNTTLALIYCLYVILSEATFSVAWLLFWLFFGLIVVLSICSIILMIVSLYTLYLKLFCSEEYKKEVQEKIANKCVEFKEWTKNTATSQSLKEMKVISKLIKKLNELDYFSYDEFDEVINDSKPKNKHKHKK